MGRIERERDKVVYKQDDGEITADLTGFVEKLELAHEGSRRVRLILMFLFLFGLIYLGMIVFF